MSSTTVICTALYYSEYCPTRAFLEDAFDLSKIEMWMLQIYVLTKKEKKPGTISLSSSRPQISVREDVARLLVQSIYILLQLYSQWLWSIFSRVNLTLETLVQCF